MPHLSLPVKVHLCGTKLIELRKAGEGIRPKAIEANCSRISAKFISKNQYSTCMASAFSFQVKVSVPLACGAVLHSVRKILSIKVEHFDLEGAEIDREKAFNLVS